MRTQSTSSQSALQWFFQTAATQSNFPNDAAPVEITRLKHSAKQLAEKLKTLPEICSEDGAARLQLTSQQLSSERETQVEFLNAMSSVGESLKRCDSLQAAHASTQLAQVLIDLLMLARTSSDIGVRFQVIKIAETLAKPTT